MRASKSDPTSNAAFSTAHVTALFALPIGDLLIGDRNGEITILSGSLIRVRGAEIKIMPAQDTGDTGYRHVGSNVSLHRLEGASMVCIL
jgi:hypothetical protein